MLISADCYYDLYLKDKSTDEVRAELDSMLSEIDRLKNKIESPYYEQEQHSYPSETEMLAACKLYLREVKAALAELGECVDIPSDKNNEEFRLRLEHLKEFRLELAGGQRQYTAYRDGGEYIVERCENGITSTFSIPAEEMLRGLAELEMGEWRRHYLPSDYGCIEPFPKPWEMRLDFFLGESVHFSGISIYPYNIGRLLMLLSAEPL